MSAGETPITYLAHAIVVPVRIDDSRDARFILDTGIGLNLVSKALADCLGLATSGEYRGKRMSGQELAVPLSRLRSLSFGTRRQEDAPVGVFDMGGFPPAFAAIDGFLSLAYFETTPFTIDYPRGVVVIETPATLAARAARAAAAPVRIDRDGPTLGLFMEMDVSVGKPALLEVDTGSDALILDLSYMARLGIDPDGADVKTHRGTDETGHAIVRHFARMKSPVFPSAAPTMRQADPPVMFEKIIYDGLVGHSFFKNFVVTYDIPNARLLLARE